MNTKIRHEISWDSMLILLSLELHREFTRMRASPKFKLKGERIVVLHVKHV